MKFQAAKAFPLNDGYLFFNCFFWKSLLYSLNKQSIGFYELEFLYCFADIAVGKVMVGNLPFLDPFTEERSCEPLKLYSDSYDYIYLCWEERVRSSYPLFRAVCANFKSTDTVI